MWTNILKVSTSFIYLAIQKLSAKILSAVSVLNSSDFFFPYKQVPRISKFVVIFRWSLVTNEPLMGVDPLLGCHPANVPNLCAQWSRVTLPRLWKWALVRHLLLYCSRRRWLREAWWVFQLLPRDSISKEWAFLWEVEVWVSFGPWSWADPSLVCPELEQLVWSLCFFHGFWMQRTHYWFVWPMIGMSLRALWCPLELS